MTDGLKYRLDKSIALLRKAEHLAKMYDPENGFYLAFSGGKDSLLISPIIDWTTRDV